MTKIRAKIWKNDQNQSKNTIHATWNTIQYNTIQSTNPSIKRRELTHHYPTCLLFLVSHSPACLLVCLHACSFACSFACSIACPSSAPVHCPLPRSGPELFSTRDALPRLYRAQSRVVVRVVACRQAVRLRTGSCSRSRHVPASAGSPWACAVVAMWLMARAGAPSCAGV